MQASESRIKSLKKGKEKRIAREGFRNKAYPRLQLRKSFLGYNYDNHDNQKYNQNHDNQKSQ